MNGSCSIEVNFFPMVFLKEREKICFEIESRHIRAEENLIAQLGLIPIWSHNICLMNYPTRNLEFIKVHISEERT